MRLLPAQWERTIMVCGKCSKKIDGGFGPGGRLSLAKALRKAIGGGKGRKAKIGIVETKCLGICPKRAVTIVDAARPGEWMLAAAGEPIDDVVSGLGLHRPVTASAK